MLEDKVDVGDLEIIKSIPIALQAQGDELVRHYSSHGGYSVKSAYHIAFQRKGNDLNRGGSSRNCNTIWKVIWGLKVPPKVRLFLWRACKNIIPVRDNLSRRGMGSDHSCPLCSFEKETVFHALIAYPAVLATWFVSPLSFRCDQLTNGTFVE